MRMCAELLALLFLVSTIAFSSFADERRPNVLLIIADDHAPYVMGAYGNARADTPNLDRLARDGMRFDRAYCASPVCTASRQSLLTGRYPRSIGVTQLRTPLPAEEITLAEALRDAGYRTGAIGKMHFNSNLRHGFDTRVDLPQHQRYLETKPTGALPPGLALLPPWRPFKDPAAVWLNAEARPYPAIDEDMAGTWFAAEAGRFIRAFDDNPFFLVVSFSEPHSPFHFPVEYAGRFDPDSFEAPEVADPDRWQVPAIFEGLSDAEKRGIAAAYYTSTAFMDRNVGRVLDALDADGHRENTLVIYIGDHGYFLGQHGRFEKHAMYEEAVRSPLVVRHPGTVSAGTSTNTLVSFVDLAPTILDWVGVGAPDVMQGRSFRDVLFGETTEHREHLVVEYSENEEAMIRTNRWKLIYTTGNRVREDGYATTAPPARRVRLFDMEADPEERNDVASAHDKTVIQLLQQLAEHMVHTSRLPDAIPDTDDIYALLDHCLQPRDVDG